MFSNIRHHALEAFLERRSASHGAGSTARVTVQPERNLTNLRGHYADTGFRSAVESILAQPLPEAANTWLGDVRKVYWLGPDEWLIVSAPGDDVATALDTGLQGRHAAVNPQSGGLLQMNLAGDAAGWVLANGCTLDLSPQVFRTGSCAQTGLGKASVLIAAMDERPAYNIFVRRSFAEYIALWLEHAGREFGLDFVVE